MIVVLSITIAFLLFLIYYIRKGSLLSASMIFAAVFLFSSIVFFLSYNYYGEDISFSTYLLIILSILMVLFGEILASSLKVGTYGPFINKFSLSKENKYCMNRIFFFAALVLCILATYMTIKSTFDTALRLGISGSLKDMMTGLRAYNVGTIRSGSNFFFSQIREFTYVCFTYYTFMFVYKKIVEHEKGHYLELLPMLLYGIIVFCGTSRIDYIRITVIVIIYAVVILQHQNIKLKVLNNKIIKYCFIGIICFLAIFFFVGSYTYSSSGYSILSNSVTKISKYTSASLLGLSKMLSGNVNIPDNALLAQNTFRNIYIFISKFGFDISGLTIHFPFFSWTNDSSNIYTSIGPAIKDFGFATPLIFGLIGYIYTRLQKKVNRNPLNIFSTYFLALFTYPIIMASITYEISSIITTSVIYDTVYLVIINRFAYRKVKTGNEL